MAGGVLVKQDEGLGRRRAAAKRTAVLLALLALVFYVAIFVLMASE